MDIRIRQQNQDQPIAKRMDEPVLVEQTSREQKQHADSIVAAHHRVLVKREYTKGENDLLQRVKRGLHEEQIGGARRDESACDWEHTHGTEQPPAQLENQKPEYRMAFVVQTHEDLGEWMVDRERELSDFI